MTITVTITQGKHSVELEFNETRVTRAMLIGRLKHEGYIGAEVNADDIVLNDGDADLNNTNTCADQSEWTLTNGTELLRRVQITDNGGVTKVLYLPGNTKVGAVKQALIGGKHLVANDPHNLRAENITLDQNGTELDNENAKLNTLGDGDLALTFTGANGLSLASAPQAKDNKAKDNKAKDNKAKDNTGLLSNIKGKATTVNSHVPQSLYAGFGAGAVLRFCHLAATSPKSYSSHIKSSLICGAGIGLGVMGIHALYQKFVKGENLTKFFSFQ